MADVGKVQGPSGPPENQGRKEKANADADKFKQAMRRRVQEVSQVDPDEQKKRKRREEAEEESAQASTQPLIPPGQNLSEEEKKISPLEMQKGKETTTTSPAAQPGPLKTEFYQAPTAAEMEDDSGMLEGEAFENPPTSSTPGYGPPSTATPQQPPQSPATPPSQATPAAAPQTPPIGPPSAQEGPVRQRVGIPASSEGKGSSTTAETFEKGEPKKAEETTAFFEQMGRKKGKERKEKAAERLEEEAEAQGVQAPAAAPGFISPQEKEKKEGSDLESGMGATPTFQTEIPSPQVAPPSFETLPPYAHLSPQMMELFDRMVGVMTVMQLSGITETTFTLNAPQFASSVFFGAQIIIQEFSTAPKAYNIQLNGNPQAVALFQGNADDLMAAFQAGNYNFRVNRLETGYLPAERPSVRRKSKVERKDKDQTGEYPQ